MKPLYILIFLFFPTVNNMFILISFKQINLSQIEHTFHSQTQKIQNYLIETFIEKDKVKLLTYFSYKLFLFIFPQYQINKINILSSMYSRDLKILLPNLTHKPLPQDDRLSTINIRYEELNPKIAILKKHKKWTLNESYVQRRISHKKHKILKPIDTLNSHSTQDLIPQNDDKSLFFTGLSKGEDQITMSRQEQREKSIQKSKKFVEIIKSHRKKLVKIRIITEPKHKASSISANPPKMSQSKELFNYLQRSFINERKQNISGSVVERFKSQSPESLFQKIEQKSRKFLLQKMQKDYKNYKQIDNFKQEQIKNLIEQQIQRKKKEFRQDYSKRYSSPYFSFLSLSKQQKSNIIIRRQLNSINSI